jgi:hypothetical protein
MRDNSSLFIRLFVADFGSTEDALVVAGFSHLTLAQTRLFREADTFVLFSFVDPDLLDAAIVGATLLVPNNVVILQRALNC